MVSTEPINLDNVTSNNNVTQIFFSNINRNQFFQNYPFNIHHHYQNRSNFRKNNNFTTQRRFNNYVPYSTIDHRVCVTFIFRSLNKTLINLL
jgi:hypothetical protein